VISRGVRIRTIRARDPRAIRARDPRAIRAPPSAIETISDPNSHKLRR
jgi:hypothetical protein